MPSKKHMLIFLVMSNFSYGSGQVKTKEVKSTKSLESPLANGINVQNLKSKSHAGKKSAHFSKDLEEIFSKKGWKLKHNAHKMCPLTSAEEKSEVFFYVNKKSQVFTGAFHSGTIFTLGDHNDLFPGNFEEDWDIWCKVADDIVDSFHAHQVSAHPVHYTSQFPPGSIFTAKPKGKNGIVCFTAGYNGVCYQWQDKESAFLKVGWWDTPKSK